MIPLLLWTLACADPSGAPMPWPPTAGAATPVTTLTIPGVELSLLPGEPWPKGQAKVDGRRLTGGDAFRAILPKLQGADATTLATLVMLFLDPGGAGQAPWTKREGERALDEQAIATPPALVGDTLTYWRFHHELAGMLRCEASLSQASVTCTLGTDVLRTCGDPLESAQKDLAAGDVYVQMNAVNTLVDAASPAAMAQLVELARGTADARVRVRAVEGLAQAKPEGVRDVLVTLLQTDPYGSVRAAAATALGTLADPAARPALQRASTGDKNDAVKSAATCALGVIGG